MASLLYLVQPQDLIPDDAPGGYGFLDDCVLLHAARLAHLTQFPNPDAKAEALHKNLNSFSMCSTKFSADSRHMPHVARGRP